MEAIEAQLDAAARICAERGAQLTELRRLVLRLILQAEGAATAYALLDRLRETRRAVPPTVYRALDFLMAQKLVHRIERLNAFVPCITPEHEHPVQFLICRQCGTVAELEDEGVAAAVAKAAAREGFRPGHAAVEVDGTCAVCFSAAG